MLVISHQERILEIADYIVVIADGNVRAFGEGKDVLPQLLKEEKSQSVLSVRIRKERTTDE